MRTVTVSVTPRLIAIGLRCSADSCPVALAIDECVGMYPEVGLQTVTLYDRCLDSRYFQADLPADVRERIAQFDEHGEMEPFSFSLTLPVVEVS